MAIISWLGSAYLIALTTAQPLSGKLTDIFDRRAGFIFCLILFGVGNLACGLARSKVTIILGRALAGIGGGGINSVTTFIVSDLVPLRSRGMWYGTANLVYCSGVGVGGVVGGVINETWGWRWAFIALTPFTVLSGLGAALFLPPRAFSEKQSLALQLGRIDFSGSILLVSAVALLLIGLNQEDFSAASSHRVLEIVLPLATACFGVFVVVELYYAREPVFPIDLLGKRTVSAACLASSFTSMAVFTLLFYVPLYFQVIGYNTSQTGVRLLPNSIGAGVGSIIVGLILRRTGKYGISKTLVFGSFVAGTAGFATVSLSTPSLAPEIHLLIIGIGQGGILVVMLLALLSSVKQEHQAVATSIHYAFRSTGATIGISLSSVVFRKLLKSRLAENSVPGAPPQSNAGPEGLDEVLRRCNSPVQYGGGQDDCPHLMDSYMYALHGTFLLATGFATAALLCAMVTRNHQLRTSFGDEEIDADCRVHRDC